MTPFVQFCLQYPDAIHLEADAHQFWCGDIGRELCSHCPNNAKRYGCNTFTSAELAYLTSNHPELFI